MEEESFLNPEQHVKRGREPAEESQPCLLCVCVCVRTLHQPSSFIHLSRLFAPAERIVLLMCLLGRDGCRCRAELCDRVIMGDPGLRSGVNANFFFCKYTMKRGVAVFSSINMLSSPSAILEFHFSFDRKDFTDILQSCGFGQFQCSLSASC